MQYRITPETLGRAERVAAMGQALYRSLHAAPELGGDGKPVVRRFTRSQMEELADIARRLSADATCFASLAERTVEPEAGEGRGEGDDS